ncbi:MAG: NADH-quinone oxidoreductase subunit NuoN [Burkholderiales bacterium]|nr:MAG: NADH-quinone oxidoreductase subunit NuoN [Burkholderiales bacterium]
MKPDPLNLLAALPEIALLVAVCAVLMIDVLVPARRRPPTSALALLALLAPLAATLWQIGTPTQYAFSNMYVADGLSHLLKLCAYIAIAATLVYGGRYARDRELDRGEFHVLALFSLLGQMVMISANNLLIVYLGLELLSLSLYALVALRRDAPLAGEAAMKYFVLGALASGFLLYGMSMIYGGAGSLEHGRIAQAFTGGQLNRTVFTFGVVFVVAGLAFKLGAVPFHMWLPDVYHGSPTATTLLIAAAPKLAAFAIAFRLLVEALIGVAADWQQMLMLLAIASLAVGNIVAIAQSNFKRMLAYSTMSHVGFVLLGLLSGVVGGNMASANGAYGSALFYVITYVLTTLGTFGLVMLLARQGFEADQIDDLKGLNQRSPWMALVMLIMMFSLAGIPPFVGFYAKLAVLKAVIDAGLVWLAVVAVLFSVVGAFYYLRVVKVMYFDLPADQSPIEPAAGARATMAVNGGLVLGLGIVPGPLLGACLEAIRQALAT